MILKQKSATLTSNFGKISYKIFSISHIFDTPKKIHCFTRTFMVKPHFFLKKVKNKVIFLSHTSIQNFQFILHVRKAFFLCESGKIWNRKLKKCLDFQLLK